MGMMKKQHQSWRWLVGALLLSIVLVAVANSYLRTVRTQRQLADLPWASIDQVIPAVGAYELDSAGFVPVDAPVTYVPDSTVEEEGYTITLLEDGMVVRHGARGDHRARATLQQLALQFPVNAKLPLGTITDQPAFGHRGVLMDVCRHFFTVDQVKRQLDLMHLYKFNVLHWHLTEDQGWRLAIEGYPKLTEVAAWRTHGDSVYGGFYTHDDVREVVAYAASLGIEVIPEIEMPGHSQAALAAYPELGCTGQPVAVATEWGVFKEIYCAGNETTFEFLEAVLDQVCDLFPSPYIHLGGDEAPKYRWEHCSKCQRRMAEEGLANEEELQRYFMTRVERYLDGKGKRIIGWDEILEGGLSPRATVQSWRGFEGAQAAAEAGHDAVVSPTSHAYFDYPISSIDVPKVYHYSPIPEGLDPLLSGHILGGECNLWSEHIPDITTLDRRFMPRAMAMAEVLWAAPAERNYQAFWKRMQGHYPLLDQLGYHYDVEEVPVRMSTELSQDGKALEVAFTPSMPQLSLTVLSEGDTALSQVPGAHLTLDQNFRGVNRFVVQPVKGSSAVGAPLSYAFALHEGLQTHSCLGSVPSEHYKGTTEIPLADGRLGSTNYRDGEWVGYFGPSSFEGHFGWNETIKIDSIKINFLQSRLSWILIPELVNVDIYVEDDVIHRWEWTRKSSPTDEGTFIETLVLRPKDGFDPTRQLTIEIPNTEHLPSNHPSAGQPVWHFLDEVQIYGQYPKN